MAPGAKGAPLGHTFYIVLIKGNLRLSPYLSETQMHYTLTLGIQHHH